MDKEQELEWLEAQKIGISEDLVAAALKQLEFLAAVDRRRWLYEGPLLARAICRYKACWLPLLAKHTQAAVVDGPLVVPLDCEWVWHCHRLNPVQYLQDCKKFYGRILNNKNVESSVRTKSKHQSEEIWAKLYPEEPFELEYSTPSDNAMDMNAGAAGGITYDLVSAVERQSSFYFQVARPSMHEPRVLEEALARYKGFLYLIKGNREKGLKRFCVPTYDVDLIWHSHQLHPVSYCNDMLKLLGRVLEHDDTDADRSKGKKLDVGFDETTKQYENTFGVRYWRAGVMYRGNLPSPLTSAPHMFSDESGNVIGASKAEKYVTIPETTVVEVFLEIVDIKNLPTAVQKESVYVLFTKKQPDMFFSDGGTLDILSKTGKKNVARLECEPTGELILIVIADLTSVRASAKNIKTIGTTSISLEELTQPDSKLSIEKWFELKHQSGNAGSTPVCLRVAASSTVPRRAPHVLSMFRVEPFSLKTCFFPLAGKDQELSCWTRFVNDCGTEFIRVQMREHKPKNNMAVIREVVGVTRSSKKPILLAECKEDKWSLNESDLSIGSEMKPSQDGSILELKGDRLIKLYWGKRLEYEPKRCSCHAEDGAAVTAVEFSAEHPYGKAVAQLDIASKLIEVNEDWFLLPWIVISFVFMNIHDKQGNKIIKDAVIQNEAVSNPPIALEAVSVGAGSVAAPAKSGDCGLECGGLVIESGAVPGKSGACGSECGGPVMASGAAPAKCGTCGSGCGGPIMKSGAAAAKCGGCGSGCGSLVMESGAAPAKCGACGSGCGGPLMASGAAPAKCGACGSGCGGPVMASGVAPVKSGACGSGCGGPIMKSGAAPAKCGGCGSGCGSPVMESGAAPAKCGACGSGCSGPVIASGACGGGKCSGKCGTVMKSGACGGCGGGECIAVAQSGRC